MTHIQFGQTSTYPVSPFMAKAADVSEKVFAKSSELVSKDKMEAANYLQRSARKTGSLFSKFDFNNVTKLGKFSIVSPPIASLIAMLYIGAIGGRLHRAAQRDPSKTEFFDVMRRDITAITIFLFLLDPLVNGINTLKDKFGRSGIHLVKQEKGNVIGEIFSYAQLKDHFKLTSKEKLEAIVAEGNGEGLQKAAKQLTAYYKNALGKEAGGEVILKQLDEFTNIISEMNAEKVALRKAGGSASSDKLAQLADSAFTKLTEATEKYTGLRASIAEQSNKAASQFGKLTKRLPEFNEMLSKYAVTKRVPGDLLSFAIVVVALGWLPVRLNDLLSRKRRAQSEAASRATNAANFKPAIDLSSVEKRL